MTDLLPALAPAPVQPLSLPSPAPDNPEEALSWLGGTVEEVAEGLRARGIKGTRREAVDCPLARYVRIWWDDASVACGTCWYDKKERLTQVMLPIHLEHFERAFDNGAFPDLIDT